ncbi:MAG: decaprenyl-phosphate phosphoribosyltransferase [Anaerolineae bacterium]|nr:decaprenyl-phosphate phosphoribosyltransferase [Anaerolineae bacterium]
MDAQVSEGRRSAGAGQIAVALLRTMRPRQWAKNVIIYAGLVFDGQLRVIDSLLRVTLAFVLLCLAAGAIYVINDLVDIEKDRLHPRKRNRPLASGQLPVPVAVVAAVVLLLVAVGGALLYSPPLAVVLAAYIALHIAYSFYLKSIVIIDVFSIAAGFMLRVVAGVVVIVVARFSPWLYVCVGFLSLFLAVGKRRQELIALNDKAEKVRATYKQYTLPLLDEMLRLVMTGSVLGYTLYTFEANASRPTMMLTVPFVVYSIMRYMYLMHVEGKGGAPEDVLFEDKPFFVGVLLWGLSVVAVLYLG